MRMRKKKKKKKYQSFSFSCYRWRDNWTAEICRYNWHLCKICKIMAAYWTLTSRNPLILWTQKQPFSFSTDTIILKRGKQRNSSFLLPESFCSLHPSAATGWSWSEVRWDEMCSAAGQDGSFNTSNVLLGAPSAWRISTNHFRLFFNLQQGNYQIQTANVSWYDIVVI